MDLFNDYKIKCQTRLRDAGLGGRPDSAHPLRPNQVDESRVDWRKVIPISCSAFLMGIAGSVSLPIMPLLFQDLSLSSSQLGMVVGAAGCARLLSNVPAGWAAEKYGRRPLLIYGPATTAVGMTMTSAVANGTQLIVCRGLTGVGGAAENTATQLYLADISNAKNRARTLAPSVMATSAGSLLGPAIGTFAITQAGLYAPFVMVGGLICVVVANNTLLIPETKKLHTPEATQGNIWRTLSSALRQWRPLLKLRDIRSILALQMAFWFNTSCCLYTLLPLMCSSDFDFSPAGISGLYMSISLMSIIGTKVSAILSDKLGRKRALVPGSILLGIASSGLPFTGDFHALCGLVGLYGVGSALYGANSVAYVSDITTEGTKAQALVMLRSSGDFGMMFGAASAGVLSGLCGSPAVPLLLSGMASIATGLNMAFRANESNVMKLKPAKKANKEKKN